MRTGTCITLIVVGAILRFAVAGGSSHGVNVHVVGIIVLLAGVLGLLLSLLMWLNPGRSRRYRHPGSNGGAPLVEERRVYAQPPVAQEPGVYQDEPPP